MQVRRLKVFPIEAIVRGYITGSAWKEYSEKGTVHGMQVSGADGRRLQESEAFERPLFTPCTLLLDPERTYNLRLRFADDVN